MTSPVDYPDDHPGWNRLIEGMRRVTERHPPDCQCRTYCLPNRGRPRARRVTRICSLDDCYDKHRARGYCNRHYQQWKRNGRVTRP